MYEEFYGLKGKAFRLSPDERFLYLGRGHKRALAYLRYGLDKREGFIVITGNVGTGKTTLAQALIKQYLSKDTVAGKLVTTQLDPDDTLRMTAAAFGLQQEGLSKASLIQYLERFFIRVREAGKHALLVVDEAQNLPARSLEELRMLSNLQQDNVPLLQCFMLAQNEFQQTVNAPGMEQFRQRIIAGYHLTPLDLGETREYIEFRLKCVGWENDPSISDEAFEVIYKHSFGIPRQINRLADRVMVAAFLEETHQIDGELATTVATELDEEMHGPKDEGVAIEQSLPASPLDKSDGGSRLAQIEEKLDALAKALGSGR